MFMCHRLMQSYYHSRIVPYSHPVIFFIIIFWPSPSLISSCSHTLVLSCSHIRLLAHSHSAAPSLFAKSSVFQTIWEYRAGCSQAIVLPRSHTFACLRFYTSTVSYAEALAQAYPRALIFSRCRLSYLHIRIRSNSHTFILSYSHIVILSYSLPVMLSYSKSHTRIIS